MPSGSIPGNKIEINTISGDKLEKNSVTGGLDGQIALDTITADNIAATRLGQMSWLICQWTQQPRRPGL